MQGPQARPTPPGSHVWLFVIARVEGSRWYPCPREIVARPDGTWSCELYLGGSPGVRHEIRVGVVDDAVHAFLARYVAANPNQLLYPDQPAGSLPRGFAEEAGVSVIRQ